MRIAAFCWRAASRSRCGFGSILCKQHGRVRHIYFPTGALSSLLTQLGGRTGLEVGLVGAEGAVGMTLALGTDIAPVRTIVQGSGSALAHRRDAILRRVGSKSRVEARDARLHLCVRRVSLHCGYSAPRFHLVEARLARWLLMTRDRAGCR